MPRQKPEDMKFAKVYPLLLQKAQKKGRSAEEVEAVFSWFCGYTAQELAAALADEELSYGDFLRQAPRLNPRREEIRGSICGVRLEEIEEPLLLEIRRLDKLIDQLAKGKSLEHLLPQ